VAQNVTTFLNLFLRSRLVQTLNTQNTRRGIIYKIYSAVYFIYLFLFSCWL